MSDKQWLLSIERAQYEADRAERQFMLADPENRLVVRSPESNWNQKLKELEKAKQDYAVYTSKIRELAAFMDDFEIVNRLNQDVLVTPEGKPFTYAGVRWIRHKHNISGPYQRNRISKHRWEV